jgi:hypothetical protein
MTAAQQQTLSRTRASRTSSTSGHQEQYLLLQQLLLQALHCLQKVAACQAWSNIATPAMPL